MAAHGCIWLHMAAYGCRVRVDRESWHRQKAHLASYANTRCNNIVVVLFPWSLEVRYKAKKSLHFMIIIIVIIIVVVIIPVTTLSHT